MGTRNATECAATATSTHASGSAPNGQYASHAYATSTGQRSDAAAAAPSRTQHSGRPPIADAASWRTNASRVGTRRTSWPPARPTTATDGDGTTWSAATQRRDASQSSNKRFQWYLFHGFEDLFHSLISSAYVRSSARHATGAAPLRPSATSQSTILSSATPLSYASAATDRPVRQPNAARSSIRPWRLQGTGAQHGYACAHADERTGVR